MIGADAIVKCLEAEDVQYVFGYPGVAICPFYNSILESDIQTILIRTEQNAEYEDIEYPENVISYSQRKAYKKKLLKQKKKWMNYQEEG